MKSFLPVGEVFHGRVFRADSLAVDWFSRCRTLLVTNEDVEGTHDCVSGRILRNIPVGITTPDEHSIYTASTKQ